MKTALLILLITTPSLLVLSQTRASTETTVVTPSGNKPVVANHAQMDKNQNKVEDLLEAEAREKIAEGNETQLARVVAILNVVPTEVHTSKFEQFSGKVTRGPWRHALYGFGGRIPYGQIVAFARSCPDLLFVQKDHEYHALMAYAARQGRARTYVWDTLGYKGDSDSAIAISDTGIDETHPNHLGYGDADFTKKIVGWRDDVGTETTPYDDNGHGSHCAGIAAGSGFYTTDANGRAVATWGAASLSAIPPGHYIISGFNVTKTGAIELYVQASDDTTVRLYYAGYSGDTDAWTRVASGSTPSGGGSTTITHNVDSAHIGYYHLTIYLTVSAIDAYIVIHWPYDPPNDGYQAWTGVANQAKLVGVKGLNAAGSGSTTDLVNGINWVIENRQKYHILVLSMSWGGKSYDSAINAAVTNAVSSGIVCVAAAGNDGSGGNYIHSPGSNPYAITVAATSLTDNVTSYSSQGGASEAESAVVKPDFSAPGGSYYMLPMFSSDSNDYDADNHYADYYTNDAAPMQGTSMSTPFIAGCANIIAQALGGYSAWDYTSNALALKVKMLLLMTATETYPLLRETKTSMYSPTLERGGKDAHEGYGRVNLDAAVEAASINWDLATTESATLYAADYTFQDYPSLPYRDAAIYRHAWARKISLVKDYNYSFVLDVPSTGDFDLYIYSSTPNTYGEPVIKWSSTQAGLGVDENIATGYLTAEEEGTYYFVVKAVSGYGTFSTGYAMPPVYIPELPVGTVVALITALVVAALYRRWTKWALPRWLKHFSSQKTI